MVALLALSDKAYVPVSIFNVLFVQYKLDRSAFARLAQLLDAPDEPGLLGGERLTKVRGELCLENVCLAYGPLQALRGVSLRLSPGQTIGFVGRSGSGKTTALRVAAGLQRPSGGSVRVDGRELYSLDLNSYFACIAYASQEAPVFDGSLRENLCPGRRPPGCGAVAGAGGLLPGRAGAGPTPGPVRPGGGEGRPALRRREAAPSPGPGAVVRRQARAAGRGHLRPGQPH